MLSRGPDIYFCVNGKSIESGRPSITDVESPTPFGGILKGTFKLSLNKLEGDSVALSSTAAFNAVPLYILLGGAGRAAGLTPPTEAEKAELPSFGMSDSGSYSFDLSLGIVRSVQVERRMKAGPMLDMTETWTIRLVEGPKR